MAWLTESVDTNQQTPVHRFFLQNTHYFALVPLSSTSNIPRGLSIAYVRSPILIGDNKRKYSSHQPWIHGTSLMWALHVWCCVTDFSSLTALLEYLATCKIRAQSPSPDDRYQIICSFVRTCYELLNYANLIFDRCVATHLCQQTRFIVPVESAGANRVPIVPEDSGSHRHRGAARVLFVQHPR